MNDSMTKKDLATLAGYSYRRLYDIDDQLPKGKKLFVKGEGGKYDLAIFVQRWAAYNAAKEHDDDETLDDAKKKHEIVKTRKTELLVAKMEGQLVDVQDVHRCWTDVANTVMQAFIGLPSKVAPQLVMMGNVDEISGILDGNIRDILSQIAETPLPEYIKQDDTAVESEEDAED